MEGRGFLLLFGFIISFCVAQNPNPECDDLVALKKNIENSGFKHFGTVHCTPNANCTGLTCSGTQGGKPFKGTVIVQGCQEPVTLLVNMGGKSFHIKNGQKIGLRKNIFVYPQISKEDNVVHITLTLKVCIGKLACLPPVKILNDQKVHVYCNGSKRVIPDRSFIPKEMQGSRPPALHYAGKKGSQNMKRNCAGVISAKKSIERNFGLLSGTIFPDSKISCSPIVNCTGLNCTGVVNRLSQEEHFTTKANVNYCSHHATLHLIIDVPKRDIHVDHTFQDGNEYEVSKRYKLYVTVHLKKNKKYILVTVTATTKLFPVRKDIYLIKNASFPIDQTHCPGYHAPEKVTSPSEHSEGQSLSKGAIAGIVITSLVVVALLAILGVWLMKRKRFSLQPATYNNVTMSGDNDLLYNDFEPAVA